MYKEVEGDLIELALSGHFDLIAHQTNCCCTQAAGIAGKFAKQFGTDNPVLYPYEHNYKNRDINKLGCIQSYSHWVDPGKRHIEVVNCYGQFDPGKRTDYAALVMCFRKLNHIHKGKKIGLPRIGCGIGGGRWDTVKLLIQEHLKDCDVTVVNYNK